MERAISLYASAIKNYALLKKEITGSRSTGTTHLGFRFVEKENVLMHFGLLLEAFYKNEQNN